MKKKRNMGITKMDLQKSANANALSLNKKIIYVYYESVNEF